MSSGIARGEYAHFSHRLERGLRVEMGVAKSLCRSHKLNENHGLPIEDVRFVTVRHWPIEAKKAGTAAHFVCQATDNLFMNATPSMLQLAKRTR